MKQLKEDFVLAMRLVYAKFLFLFIYLGLTSVIFPESHRVVDTVNNVKFTGAVLYVIVAYSCVVTLLAVYSYSAVKEKIGESQSFVKRFAFIVGVQTVLFIIVNNLYTYYVDDRLLHRPINYKIVYDGSGVGMIPESVQTIAMTLTVVVVILAGRRIMTGLAAMSRK